MADAPKLKKRSYTGAVLGFLLVVVAPTLLAAYYYMTIHVDRYVVELRYSVRGGAMLQAAGESGLTQGATGALVFAADSFVLEDYIASVQAFEDIERRLPDLRQMLGKDGGDPVRRYDPDLPAEDMLPFWQEAVRPRFDAITGITTVDVSFYTPEDAQAVATALVGDLNELADNLSRDARTEMLTYVNDQFNLAAEELRGARSAVEDFRRQNRTFSPDEEVTAESRISAELSQQLTEKRLELRTLRQRAPNSPRLPTLRDEIDALQAQIIAQFEERETGGATLSSQLAEYEALQQTYEFASVNYLNTFNLKQQAEANASLSQAQLVVFVKPRMPRRSIEPNRPLEIGLIFGYAFLGWLIVRIFLAGLRTG